MKWTKQINNIFNKRYGELNKYLDVNDFYDIWNNWNDDFDRKYPFILFDRNETEISNWLEEEGVSYVNCIFIENGKVKKYRKISLKENDKINLSVKKTQLASIEDIICFDDCRCIILDKTNKKRPTFYMCLDKYNKKINKMLDIFKNYIKNEIPNQKKLNIKKEKQKLEEKRQEKEQQAKKKHYKSLLNKGIYHMLDDGDRVFFEMCTRSNGFLSGEFITLAYTTNVPIHQFTLMLHRDLWDVLGRNKKDVLFLTANDKGFFTDIVKKLFSYDEDNKCLNNIGLNITSIKQIESILLSKRPKIIFVDNLQSIDGNSAENVRLLKKMCKKLKITCFCLFEMNNVNPKKVPDISNIGKRSGIVDQSDKVFIIWNVEKINWYTTFYDFNKINPEYDYDSEDYDENGELYPEVKSKKVKGHKERIYTISIDCVKNRRYKLFRDFVWYCLYDNNLETINLKNKGKIIRKFKELFGDGSYSGFDTRSIAQAIDDLSSAISSKEIPTFDGFVWNMN